MKEAITNIPEQGAFSGGTSVETEGAKPIQLNMKPREPKDRVTVYEQITHVSVAHGTESFQTSGSRWLSDAKEQPYERRCTVGTEWQPLDLGWLAEAGISMLIIKNTEDRTKPDEGLLEIAVGRLGTPESDLYPSRVIYPSLSERTCPTPSCAIWVRGVQEITHFTVFAVPK